MSFNKKTANYRSNNSKTNSTSLSSIFSRKNFGKETSSGIPGISSEDAQLIKDLFRKNLEYSDLFIPDSGVRLTLPTLDPTSDKFDYKKGIGNLIARFEMADDKSKIPPTTGGPVLSEGIDETEEKSLLVDRSEENEDCVEEELVSGTAGSHNHPIEDSSHAEKLKQLGKALSTLDENPIIQTSILEERFDNDEAKINKIQAGSITSEERLNQPSTSGQKTDLHKSSNEGKKKTIRAQRLEQSLSMTINTVRDRKRKEEVSRSEKDKKSTPGSHDSELDEIKKALLKKGNKNDNESKKVLNQSESEDSSFDGSSPGDSDDEESSLNEGNKRSQVDGSSDEYDSDDNRNKQFHGKRNPNIQLYDIPNEESEDESSSKRKKQSEQYRVSDHEDVHKAMIQQAVENEFSKNLTTMVNEIFKVAKDNAIKAIHENIEESIRDKNQLEVFNSLSSNDVMPFIFQNIISMHERIGILESQLCEDEGDLMKSIKVLKEEVSSLKKTNLVLVAENKEIKSELSTLKRNKDILKGYTSSLKDEIGSEELKRQKSKPKKFNIKEVTEDPPEPKKISRRDLTMKNRINANIIVEKYNESEGEETYPHGMKSEETTSKSKNKGKSSNKGVKINEDDPSLRKRIRAFIINHKLKKKIIDYNKGAENSIIEEIMSIYKVSNKFARNVLTDFQSENITEESE